MKNEKKQKDSNLKLAEKYDFVVIGGSLPGMVAALVLKKKYPNSSVLLVDGAQELGGNLIGHNALGTHFDSGTHILQEIGDEQVDNLIASVVSPQNLVVLDSAIGDFAATIKENKIWSATGFPDVLAQDPKLANQISMEVMDSNDKHNQESQTSFDLRRCNIYEAAVKRYGQSASVEVVMPLVRRIFGESSDLSGFALELCNLTRLRLVDTVTWNSQIVPRGLQDRIAYPDQSFLPSQFRHKRKSLYSRERGASDFVRGLLRECVARGIEVLTSTKVEVIGVEERSITLAGSFGLREIQYHQLFSSVGSSRTKMLVTQQNPSLNLHTTLRLIHIVLKEPTVSKVCYFYSQDESSVVFRITNYSAFSGRENDCRLTVESIGQSHLSDEVLKRLVLREIIEAGITQDGLVDKSECLSVPNGYPIPTVATFESFLASSNFVRDFEKNGLFTSGIGAGDGLFFQNEILRHTVRVIRENF